MSDIPEDTKTVEGEGKDLASAIASAAEELGVDPGDVAYKLDLSHFRNQTGGMKPARSVKIIGWVEEGATDIGSIAAGSGGGRRKRSGKKRSGKKRSGKKSGKRSGKKSGKKRSGKKSEKKAPASDVDAESAAEFAESWFSTLLDHMGIDNTVTGTADDDRVHLDVRAERAGRVIGRRGSTLRAIRYFLRQALDQFGSPKLDIDVEDKDKDKGSGKKKKKKKKSGKKKQKSGGKKGGYPEAKLQALAKRAAEKARDTDKTVTINLQLSSYDRRIVHLAVSEIDGVHSQSEEKDGGKVVQVIPD